MIQSILLQASTHVNVITIRVNIRTYIYYFCVIIKIEKIYNKVIIVLIIII